MSKFAQSGTRTHTGFLPRDFKSLVSTIPPSERGKCIYYSKALENNLQRRASRCIEKHIDKEEEQSLVKRYSLFTSAILYTSSCFSSGTATGSCSGSCSRSCSGSGVFSTKFSSCLSSEDFPSGTTTGS